MKRILYAVLFTGIYLGGQAQLNIGSAGFYIPGGGIVAVQGDVTSSTDIQGTGLFVLNGTAAQQLDMGGYSIPNLELNNSSNVALLNNNTRIGSSLAFTNGKLQTGNLDLVLSSAASTSGAGASKFIQINGTGRLVKELVSDIAAFELPVGENNNYRPAYLTTSGSVYSSAQFSIRVLGSADASMPPMIASYLGTNWPVTKSGITGGTVTLSGQYVDPTDVTGAEANIVGYYHNGIEWSSSGESHNTGTNRVGVPVSSSSGVVAGFNKFLAVGSRAFLQGAYSTVTGLMADNLRSLPFGSSSSTANFPSTDPYRVAPYNSVFTHVDNAATETIPNSGVIGAQPSSDDNIVDWVFLELRNQVPSPGNVILQTRSALVQKDGDIVDVDGVSPVTFNNLADGYYVLTVRHRNHLGLSYNLTTPKALTESKILAYDVSKVFDFRTAPAAELYGTSTAYTTASHPVLSTINLLWGGNANSNSTVRFSSISNDRDAIFQALGNNASGVISNIYHASDVNMNKTVRFSGLNNDRDFLFQILGNNISTVRTQVIPN